MDSNETTSPVETAIATRFFSSKEAADLHRIDVLPNGIRGASELLCFQAGGVVSVRLIGTDRRETEKLIVGTLDVDLFAVGVLFLGIH